MYEMKARVRYSEVGPDRKLKLISLIDYLQDCATFHSEDLGLGLDYLNGNHIAWLMISWQIQVERYPELAEKFTIETWPHDLRSFYAHRNIAVRDEAGNLIVKANSLWMLVSQDNGRPRKPLPEQIEKYQIEPKLEMEYAPRKIALPEHMEAQEPQEVLKYMIDTNGHTNNGQYILMARECLPEKLKIREVRAEYRSSAVLGDRVYPYIGKNGDAIVVRLDDKDGNIFAISEFR